MFWNGPVLNPLQIFGKQAIQSPIQCAVLIDCYLNFLVEVVATKGVIPVTEGIYTYFCHTQILKI